MAARKLLTLETLHTPSQAHCWAWMVTVLRAQAGATDTLDTGPDGPGQPLPPVRPTPVGLHPSRATPLRSIPQAGGSVGAGREAGASVGGIGVLAAGGRLEQLQGLPRELGQVRGTDITAALSLRATRRDRCPKRAEGRGSWGNKRRRRSGPGAGPSPMPPQQPPHHPQRLISLA